MVRELTVPAHGTLTLTPFGDDVILENPAAYENLGSLPLVLTFRHAGKHRGQRGRERARLPPPP